MCSYIILYYIIVYSTILLWILLYNGSLCFFTSYSILWKYTILSVIQVYYMIWSIFHYIIIDSIRLCQKILCNILLYGIVLDIILHFILLHSTDTTVSVIIAHYIISQNIVLQYFILYYSSLCGSLCVQYIVCIYGAIYIYILPLHNITCIWSTPWTSVSSIALPKSQIFTSANFDSEDESGVDS